MHHGSPSDSDPAPPPRPLRQDRVCRSLRGGLSRVARRTGTVFREAAPRDVAAERVRDVARGDHGQEGQPPDWASGG